MSFSETHPQTPAFGALSHSGDKGGTFFFRQKTHDIEVFRPIELSLELNSEVSVTSDFRIPFFNRNGKYDNNYINVFVQHVAYSIVNEVRMLITSDEGYFVKISRERSLQIEVGFAIQTLNNRYLSMVIGRYDDFGGVHPNHYFYSLNFTFKPDRKLCLYDILDTGDKDLMEFLLWAIDEYGIPECSDILKEQVTYESGYNLGFFFDDTTFTVDFTNHLPHVAKPGGMIQIPIEKINFRI